MFVKVQGRDGIINLESMIMIQVVEDSGVYKIKATTKSGMCFTLASYDNKKDADNCMECFCTAIKEGEKFFKFWDSEENNG